MLRKMKSIQTQFILITTVVILVALSTVGMVISLKIVERDEANFINQSKEKMTIIEKFNIKFLRTNR